ncbi:MAG: hypothetical protein WAP35_03815 [Solirubrobacterales bacterium]
MEANTNTRTRPKPGNKARKKQKPISQQSLLAMSQKQLDDLFTKSPCGEIPVGESDGMVVLAAGSGISKQVAELARIAWRGKVFNPAGRDLKNRILPIEIRALRAKVYMGTSRFDGKPVIVLDYKRSSPLTHWIRDEIREVAPGLYLGVVYWSGRKTIDFSLYFPKQARRGQG